MNIAHQRLSVWLVVPCLTLPLSAGPRVFGRCTQRRKAFGAIGSGRLPASSQADSDPTLRVVPRCGQASRRATARYGRGARSRGARAGLPSSPATETRARLINAVRGEGATERMPLNRPPLSASEIELAPRLDRPGGQGDRRRAAGIGPESVALGVHSAPTPHCAKCREPSSGAKPDRPFHPGSARAGRACVLPRKPTGRHCCAGLSLDLIGLPPSPEEVDAFLADRSEYAYERAVDRLLASPHFGERWARPWLDQARYADSNGFNIDAPRSIWKYRDWVIAAFNADMPFDQFTIDQIAGDLQPNASLAPRIATGFHRNTQINQEGGIDVEQFRVEAVIDRVNTTGTVFLGLTIGCAQCHDHKYDPIAQRDYYRLFAFFNNVDEPELEIAAPADLARRKAIRSPDR